MTGAKVEPESTERGLIPGDCVEIEAGDGEILYVLRDDDDVRLLLAAEREIHRGQIWTKDEIRALVAVRDDAEVLAEIRRLKRMIPGRLSWE